MLDLHTHILPEMDDGSKSVRQSITMLRREAKQGVDKVILTPHFYAEKELPTAFFQRRKAATKLLATELAFIDNLPQAYLGAEVAYFNGISRADEISRFRIGRTRAMLIEMPFTRWTQPMVDEIFYLKENRSIQPIIAHIDRYIRYQPRGTVEQLCEFGIWIQANTDFFLQWQTSWTAMRMLRAQRIHFIGSDCHNTKTRPPNMNLALDAIEQKLGKSALEHLQYMEEELLGDE